MINTTINSQINKTKFSYSKIKFVLIIKMIIKIKLYFNVI
jgi:hypothetical protein